MKKGFKRTVALALVLCMTSLTACGNSGNNNNTNNTSATNNGTTNDSNNASNDDAKEDAKPIQMQLCYWDSDAPTGDEPMIKEIEKATNSQLNITWAPPSAMAEKTSTTISGGKLPEVLEIINPEMRTQIVQDAMTGGMFWDLTDLIKDYPNLAAISENTYNSMRYDGKIYTIPRMIPARDSGVIMREDWLNNLGLEKPKTLDDYYNVLKAFTKDDPDGNGKNDTVGLNMFVGCVVSPLCLAAGCPINWWIDESDNSIKPMQEHPNYMTYLNFMKKCYDEGLVNLDFTAATQTSAEQAFMEGKCGMIPGSIGKITQGTYFAPLFERDANAKLVASTESIGPDGKKYANPNPGYWGMYAISKSAVKDEARVRKILQFFNDTMNKDVLDFFVKGIKDVHYTEKDGKFEWLDNEKFIKDSKGTSAFYVASVITEQLNLGLGEHDKEYYAWETDKTAIEFPDLGSWFVTPENITVTKTIEDAANKYVMGSIDENKLKSEWERWAKEGGSDLVKAYTDQYRTLIGK